MRGGDGVCTRRDTPAHAIRLSRRRSAVQASLDPGERRAQLSRERGRGGRRPRGSHLRAARADPSLERGPPRGARARCPGGTPVVDSRRGAVLAAHAVPRVPVGEHLVCSARVARGLVGRVAAFAAGRLQVRGGKVVEGRAHRGPYAAHRASLVAPHRVRHPVRRLHASGAVGFRGGRRGVSDWRHPPPERRRARGLRRVWGRELELVPRILGPAAGQ